MWLFVEEHAAAILYYLTGISLFLCVTMLIVIIRKIRCKKKRNRSGKSTPEYEVELSTELTIYAFFTFAILWATSRGLESSIVPLSQYLGSSASSVSLCSFAIVALRTCGVSFEIALVNILTNRLSVAFHQTGSELPKWTNYCIRSSALVIWSTIYLYVFVLFAIVRTPLEEHVVVSENKHCLRKAQGALEEHEEISLILLSLASSLGLWLLFMVKLYKFRDSLFSNGSRPSIMSRNGEDHDILLSVMKKQSIIMLWVTVSTFISATIHIVSPVDLHKIVDILDLTGKAIAIFLSFAFNNSWYIRCGCNRCVMLVLCCYRCKCTCTCSRPRPRQQRDAGTQVNLQTALSLEHRLPTNTNQTASDGKGQQDDQDDSSRTHSKSPTLVIGRASSGVLSIDLTPFTENTALSRNVPPGRLKVLNLEMVMTSSGKSP